MSNCRLLGALAVVVFCVGGLSGQTLPKREFRGAWIATVTNLDWPSTPGLSADVQQAQLVSILDNLEAAGINEVMFQVRSECDAMYQSSIDPWSYWLTGVQGQGPNPSYDPLAFAVQEAHKRGMELHAWFNPYRAVRSVGGYPLASNHVSVLHPNWVIQIGTFKFLNPGLAAVRQYVTSVVMDVVRRYDVDGVHFDDYFYPYPPNQISTEDDTTFARDPRGFTNQADWRRDNVNLLVKMIHDSIQAVKPYVKFGISPFGIWRHNYPPSVGSGTLSAYDDIYCDALAWVDAGTIDYLTPQLYWNIGSSLTDYSKLMPWWADSVAAHGLHFYPGKAAYRISSWSASELPNQIRLDRANPKVEGTVFFRANNGINDNLKGFSDSLSQNLYRYPALLPIMAWKDATPPYPPRGIQYSAPVAGGPSAIQWDPPIVPAGQDSAVRYAVYAFDHYPQRSELDDSKNLVSVTNGTSAIPPVPYASPGQYFYIVTALDHNWNESDTSNVVVASAPLATLLLLPASGTLVPDSVMFTWRSPGNTSQFHLEVGTDSQFVSTLFLSDSTVVDTFMTVRGLKGETRYYWRVRAGNAGGWGAFSPVASVMTWQPASPPLLSPPNYQTDVPLAAELLWQKSAVATSYRIQVAKSQDFSTIVVDTSGIADTSLTTPPLASYTAYYWHVRGVNAQSVGDWSATFRFRTVLVQSVDQQENVPTVFALFQNYPNPFNPTTVVSAQWPVACTVRLVVYDELGRQVAVLADGRYPAGTYTFTFDASRLASGVYFYRLSAGSYVATKHMLFLK